MPAGKPLEENKNMKFFITEIVLAVLLYFIIVTIVNYPLIYSIGFAKKYF